MINSERKKSGIRLQEKNGIGLEEYLAAERESEIKNEYFGGEIFAMAGASREHNQISANTVRVLGNQMPEQRQVSVAEAIKVSVYGNLCLYRTRLLPDKKTEASVCIQTP